ncbi:MAG: hypothetical protein H6757_04470 [Candidatus Omnitrophica bacterium]|nr:hypothetical protein [Candidatus Omnitrophota bacterium]
MTVYFLLKYLFYTCLILWPVTLVFTVGAIRLFIYGKKVGFTQSLVYESSLKKGDILLMGKQSVYHSWQIQMANVLTGPLEERFWTHTALYAGDGKLWEARPEGVHERRLADYFEEGYYVFAVRHRYIKEDGCFDRLMDFFKDNQDCRYGWIGVLFYSLSILIPVGMDFVFKNKKVDEFCHLDHAYFCSEIIVDGFQSIGFRISAYDGWRVKPADFLHNPFFEPVSPVLQPKAAVGREMPV